MKRIALVTLVLVASSLVVPGARAQEIEDRSLRLAGGLVLGMEGELDANVGDLETNGDLDPSIGFDVRAELPVADFLAIGGWFQFLTVEGEAMGSEREETLSFDAFVRGRWVVEAVQGELFLEPYVLVPIGLSLAILGNDDDVWAGFNTGVFGGIQVLHASGFGGYLEAGWRHAQVFRKDDVPIVGDIESSLVLNEFALNLGVVFALGGS
ncbi:MAG: hypothetical protein J0L92_28130 [Deltaproteobacteria bacterium]|nr:hypothetical protein [Deltaproteobacteria bacterium]